MDKNSDSQRLVKFREKYQISQLVLAKLLGVTKRTIANWENGWTKVPISTSLIITLMYDDEDLYNSVVNGELL